MKRLITLLALASLALSGLHRPERAQAGFTGLSPATLKGILTVVWGDAPDGIQTPALYRLHVADGRTVQLLLGQTAGWTSGDLLEARGQTLQVSGLLVSAAGASSQPDGIGADLQLQVEQIESLAGLDKPGATPPGMFGSHPWVSILCRFNDYPAAPHDRAYFQDMYANAPGRLDHYWREQSYGQANVSGSDAVGWFVLPRPRAAYNLNGDPRHFNLDLAASDCSAAADGSVNFSQYDGINLMFNADLDGFAWGGQHWFNNALDGKNYFYVTWEPPWGYADITVIQHEMGHGFGLPHSSYSDNKNYDNAYDIMSDAWQGCFTAPAFRDSVYGCMGQGTIAYHRQKLGWIPADKIKIVGLSSTAQVTLDWLEAANAPDYRMIQIPVDNAGRLYTVELRGFAYASTYNPWPGYDQKFHPFMGPDGDQGVIIHEVEASRESPAHVIDLDGNGNTADAGTYFLPGEGYTSPDGQVTIRVLSASAGKMTVQVNNGLASQAPTSLQISGPNAGVTDREYSFTATVLPLDETAPLTYTWRVAGQPPVIHQGGSSDTITLSWTVTGTQPVSVTAVNALGSISQTINFPVVRSDALAYTCPFGQKCLLLSVIMK